ncbi:MAG: AraC family transcriptional regulator [Steroidobacteraceae bacterium]
MEIRVERDTPLTSRPLPMVDGWLFCVSTRGTMLEHPEAGALHSSSSHGMTAISLQHRPRVQIMSLHALTVVLDQQALHEVAESLHAAPTDRHTLALAGVAQDQTIRRLASLLLPELAAGGRSHTLFVEHLLQAFCVHIALTYANVAPGTHAPRGGLATWQLRRAQEILRANLDEAIRLQHVAEACRLSVSHFSRAFRKSTGMAPYAWLQTQRIEAAKSMLRASASSLSDVAVACGFSDQSHFTRVFHRAVGASPGAWRRVVLVNNR